MVVRKKPEAIKEKGFIPDTYRSQTVEISKPDRNGVITKMVKLSDPVVPEGMRCDRNVIYHRLAIVAGTVVKYEILDSDGETVLKECSTEFH